ncbi:FG-GAP-like repeat-containing protein [Marivirga arenosa]|uniref:FG-GAP-like repeat-containing protein n=1 Tax=Marivirga arenosa TaxID=3059076 RepID=A0AA51ZVE6_9BACT|nr:FG-GAP-like repeat-containing protein [Marivirga sp. BKB1-2]WNB17456.1 FG-GAP-like repeat-containing protein [Marivirga sp. BKB1-2]
MKTFIVLLLASIFFQFIAIGNNTSELNSGSPGVMTYSEPVIIEKGRTAHDKGFLSDKSFDVADPIPSPDVQVSSTTQNSILLFLNNSTATEFDFNIEVSVDDFVTFLPAYNPAIVSSLNTSFSISGLTPGQDYNIRIWGERISQANSDTIVIQTQTNPFFINSIADGDWSDPSIWAGGVVPPADSAVNIYHKVTINSGEIILIDEVNIVGNFEETPHTGIWINDGNLTIDNNLKISDVFGAQISDSVGVFITANPLNQASLVVGNNFIIDKNEILSDTPLRLEGFNNGDSLLIKVGGNMDIRQLGSALSPFMGNYLNLQNVTLDVSGRLSFFNDRTNSAQFYKSNIFNSKVFVGSFQMDAIQQTNEEFQVNFTGNTEMFVYFDFLRNGAGGKINFQDQSILHMVGNGYQQLSGFGIAQDSIIYNDLIINLADEPNSDSRTRVEISASYGETISQLYIKNELNFINGVIRGFDLYEGFQREVIIGSNGSVSGIQKDSYVQAPLGKIGNTPFTFAVGNGTGLKQIRINNNEDFQQTDLVRVNPISNYCGEFDTLFISSGLARDRFKDTWEITSSLTDVNVDASFEPIIYDLIEEGITNLDSLALVNFQNGSVLGISSSTDSSFVSGVQYSFALADTARLGLASTSVNQNPFYYRKEIVSYSQNSAAPGESVTLNLSGNFGPVIQSVYFGSKSSNVVSSTENSVTVTVPFGAQSGQLKAVANDGKIYYSRRNFTVSNSTIISNLNAAFDTLTVVGNVNGSAPLGQSTLKLGTIDADNTIDAVITTASYDSVAYFRNLEGQTTYEPFNLIVEGNQLNPTDIDLELSNISGNPVFDFVLSFSFSSINSIIYFQNDGNGNFTNLGDGANDPNINYNDFDLRDLDYDGFTDIIYPIYDFSEGINSNIAVANIISSGENCSPYASIPPAFGTAFNQEITDLNPVFFTESQNDVELNYIDLDSGYLSNTNFFSQSNSSFRSNFAVGEIFQSIVVSPDGDGLDNIVSSNIINNEIRIFDGTSYSFVALSFAPAVMVAEDMDGDGLQDLVVSDYNNPAIHILLNDGAGSFAESNTYNYPGSKISGLAVADLNADEVKDIIMLRENGDLAVAYFSPQSTEVNPPSVSLSNLNSNGFSLNWSAVNDAVNYKVYIGKDNNPNTLSAGDSTITVFSDSLTYVAPEYSELYSYAVKAYTNSGDSSNYSAVNSIKLPVSTYLESDSLAMVALYDSLDGANWTSSTNWLTGKLNTWEGLSMKNDSLFAINLSNKQLSGALPAELGSLNFVNQINLASNNITSILSLVPISAQLNSFNVSSNRLAFEQLQAYSSISNFSYSNQDTSYIIPESYIDFLAAEVSLEVSAPASSNTFQWFKDSTAIAGATDSILTFGSVARSDEGNYYVEVSNSLLPGLILNSNITNLKVSSLERDIAALKKLYESTGGENWSTIVWDTTANNPETWSDDPNDIIVQDNRVVEINLPENNLTGSVPEEIAEILGLRVLDVSNNAIENLADLSTLPILETLNVSGNALGFDDLEPQVVVPSFNFENQANFGVTEDKRFPHGSSFLIDYLVQGSANTYQWYKDGTLVNGKDSSSILYDSITYELMGSYQLEVGNEMLNILSPDFRIKSNPVNIIATANLSGLMFDTNEFPTESGKVHLFKFQEGEQYDSVQMANGEYFVNLKAGGVFDILNLDLGDYILYVDNNESDYPNLINTYYPNTIDWELAEVIQHRSDQDGLSVTMEGEPQELNGTSRFSGYFEEVFGEEERMLPRRRVKGAGVSVRRLTGSSREISFRTVMEEGELVAYLETDENGEFIIPNLPAGKYTVKFDRPGVPMDEDSDIVFELTGEDQEALEISATSENGKISVKRVRYTANNPNKFLEVKLFPNPAKDKIEVISLADISKISLLSAEGKLIQSINEKNVNNKYEFNLSNQAPGIYFIQIISTNGINGIYKVIKE